MSTHKIPKILHQLWIGPKSPPTRMLETWKEKHPDYEYILWTEAEFARREFVPSCIDQINLIAEINGKADILRWEILYKYGGVFFDADSICIEPLDEELFLTKTGFASFENETERGNLIATGSMGFVPNHPLCGDIIEWVRTDPSAEDMIRNYKAWYSVGPALLTRFLETGKYSDFTIFPSHFFLPHHFTGNKYDGHQKVYAYQEWANTKQSYDTIDTIELPVELTPPEQLDVVTTHAPLDNRRESRGAWISILIPSYQAPKKHIRECLNSIRCQYGSHIGYEIVWINDGSDKVHSKILESELKLFLRTSRFCKIRCFEMTKNLGVAECLRQGVELCSHEIIARMDVDDMMVPHRLITQYNYMMSHPEVQMCGTGIRLFRDDTETGQRIWMHDRMFPTLTLSEFQEEPKTWIMSHPSMMMRKSAILNVGNYRDVYKTFAIQDAEIQGTRSILDDFDLECRILKTYGELHNIPEILMYYRIHEKQVTYDKTVETSSLHSVCVSKIIGSIEV
jgi:mannosyltransferase OCH1-like enzyme